MPSLDVFEVALRGLREFVVFHVPDGFGSRTSGDDGEVGDELAEADVRGVLDQGGERLENFVLKFVVAHGSISPKRGDVSAKLSPENRNRILGEDTAHAQQRRALGESLGDQETVERIFVRGGGTFSRPMTCSSDTGKI